jgi:ribonuclease J
VVREGRSPSESDVAKRLAEIIAASPNRVAVTTFASNVARIRAVALAAKACGRECVAVGRAMDRIIEVARECGYLDGLPDFRQPQAYG